MKTNPEIILEKYNKTAIKYASREERLYWIEFPNTMALNYINSHKVDLVIDIGCGSGALIRNLAPNFPSTKFLGVDFSENLIKIAEKSSSSKNLMFKVADLVKSNEMILDEIKHVKNNILLLAIGPMAYYEKEDDFTKSLVKLWNEVKSGGLIATFHNKQLIGRIFLGKKHQKKYWQGSDSLDIFCKESDNGKVKYFSFILNDLLASKISIFDNLLVMIESINSKLPMCIAKKINTNFGINVERK